MGQEQGRHVGQGTSGNQGHRLGALPQDLRHHLHGALLMRRPGRLRQSRAVQPALPMHGGGYDGIARQGQRPSPGHGQVQANQGTDPPGVIGGLLDGLVAADGGDSPDIQHWAGLGQHPGNRIVMARVPI